MLNVLNIIILRSGCAKLSQLTNSSLSATAIGWCGTWATDVI